MATNENKSSEIKVLEVKIEGLEKDVDNVREEIKSVKADIKEHDRLFTETLAAMRDNITRLTVLAEKQDEQLDFLRSEVKEMKGLHESKLNEDKKWYQKMIESNGKLFWYILFIVLASALGYNFHDIVSILFHL